MADRLISADALDNALTELRFNEDGELAHWGDREDWCLHGNEIEKLIADAPTVDAEPVRHGHWVENNGRYGWYCSQCKKENNYAYDYNENNVIELQDHYCPNCGADMRGREDATD